MTVLLTESPRNPAVSAQGFPQAHCVNVSVVRVCKTTDRMLGIRVTWHLGSLPRETVEFPSVKVIQSVPGQRSVLTSAHGGLSAELWQVESETVL